MLYTISFPDESRSSNTKVLTQSKMPPIMTRTASSLNHINSSLIFPFLVISRLFFMLVEKGWLLMTVSGMVKISLMLMYPHITRNAMYTTTPFFIFISSSVINVGIKNFSENAELSPRFDIGIISMKYMTNKNNCFGLKFFHFINSFVRLSRQRIFSFLYEL